MAGPDHNLFSSSRHFSSSDDHGATHYTTSKVWSRVRSALLPEDMSVLLSQQQTAGMMGPDESVAFYTELSLLGLLSLLLGLGVYLVLRARNHPYTNLYGFIREVYRRCTEYFKRKFAPGEDVLAGLTPQQLKNLCKDVALQDKVLKKLQLVEVTVKAMEDITVAYVRRRKLAMQSEAPSSSCSCSTCQSHDDSSSGFDSQAEM